MKRLLIAAAGLILGSSSAFAEGLIYKCPLDNGRYAYQDRACKDGTVFQAWGRPLVSVPGESSDSAAAKFESGSPVRVLTFGEQGDRSREVLALQASIDELKVEKQKLEIAFQQRAAELFENSMSSGGDDSAFSGQVEMLHAALTSDVAKIDEEISHLEASLSKVSSEI